MKLHSNHIIIRNTVVHLLVWSFIIYILNLKVVDIEWGFFDRKDGSILIPLIYGCATGAIVFYLTAYVLIPKFFLKRKQKALWISTLALILGISLIESFIDLIYVYYLIDPASRLQLIVNLSSFPFLILLFSSALIPNSLCWIGALAFKLPGVWIKTERQKHTLVQEKLRSELNLLKSQLNPHFLLNTINNIYFQIKKDPETAAENLLKFSELLRMQLYEFDAAQIPLSKELEFITNYIELQKLRFNKDVIVEYHAPYNIDGINISPLLFITLIENAFKHVSRVNTITNIRINIRTDEQYVTLSCSNTFDNNSSQQNKNSGIGLANLRKQLDIVYKDKYQFDVSRENNIYEATLSIKYNE